MHYLEYFLQLGNIEEYFRLEPTFYDELSPSNIVDRLIFLYSQPRRTRQEEIINKFLKYASANFENICKEDKNKLDVEILSSIMKDPNIKLKDEDSLLEFILDKYEQDKEYSVLFEYVIFSNVSKRTLERFINEFDIEFLNFKIWEGICARLLCDRSYDNKNDSKNKNSTRYLEIGKEEEELKMIEKEHKEGEEFNGLLRYLSEGSNGNIHDNGTINITSNSIYNDNNGYHPKNLVNYQNNEQNNYQSKNDNQDIYVCFDLKDRRIQMTSYSIKSYAAGQNWHHLKNWKIEVSNDGNEWTTIDEHKNDSTLNGDRAIGTFKIQQETQFYRFIRLHQTGKNWANGNLICFYCIEFYGKLKEPTKK